MSRHEQQVMVQQWIVKMLDSRERAGVSEWMP